jgi:redox-sensing transcriptional repressor
VVAERTVERLHRYCRLLQELSEQGRESVFSHDLADLSGATPAQVRRDLMAVGGVGRAKLGYDLGELLKHLHQFLLSEGGDNVALVGVGNIGMALLPYFLAYRTGLRIVATFDKSEWKAGRVFHGRECLPMQQLEPVIEEMGIKTTILAIPAGEAQPVAERLCAAGVTGILNFAPAFLKVPSSVWVENMDMGVVLEKVVFMARQRAEMAPENCEGAQRAT